MHSMLTQVPDVWRIQHCVHVDAHAIFSRVQSARVTGYEEAAGCEGHSGEPGHDRASSALPYKEHPMVLSSRGSLH